MSDTPRTDALEAERNGPIVEALKARELARDLERELAEAKEAANEERRAYLGASNHRDRLMDENAAQEVQMNAVRYARDRAERENAALRGLLSEIATLKRYDPNGAKGWNVQEPYRSVWVALALLERIDAALAANPCNSDGGWIAVSERLPEGSGVLVLVALDPGDHPDTMPGVGDFHNGRFEVYDDKFADCPVTHWMPFPAKSPPAGSQGVHPHDDASRAPILERLEGLTNSPPARGGSA
jgi:hypothetical protein